MMPAARLMTIATVAALAVAGLAPITPAAVASGATRSKGPTRAQIAHAVRGATRSRYLWATVNVCERSHAPGGLMGVRGEMPALGFDARLTMAIQLRQYVTARRRWVNVAGTTAHQTTAIGVVRSGVRQDGVEFPYRSNTGALDARVTFTWTLGARRLAQTVRTTSGGHPSAAYGRPAHHSTATCRL